MIRPVPRPERREDAALDPQDAGARLEDDAGHGDQALATAFEQRTRQLYEARSALAEAVSTLRTELGARREEIGALRGELERVVGENAALRAHLQASAVEAEDLRQRVRAFEQELHRVHGQLAEVRQMKVLRWTAGPRRLVYRLRARRR
jgi:regulator of replication initiation timing